MLKPGKPLWYRVPATWWLVLASLAASLAVCEGALYFMHLYPTRPYPPVTARPTLYQRFDPHGYRLWPSRTTTYMYPLENPRQLTLVSNRDGFRSRREFNSIDGRPRVLVLGDSMVFGEGVEESERFTNLLEGLQPAWRVDNLGMPGYGPDLMLRALEQVGLGLNAQVIVLCIYTDDLRRVSPYYAGAGFPTPRFVLQGDELVTIPYPKPRLLERFRLGVAIRGAFARLGRQADNVNGPLRLLNQAILDRFLRHSKVHHFLPAIVFIPEKVVTPLSQTNEAWVRDYAMRTNTPYLDLTGAIQDAGAERIFIPRNTHLNPAGHEVVARALLTFISTKVPPPTASEHR